MSNLYISTKVYIPYIPNEKTSINRNIDCITCIDILKKKNFLYTNFLNKITPSKHEIIQENP